MRNLQEISITSSTIIYAYAEIGTVATKAVDENLWKSQLPTTKTNY
jgi:hypothetical protein